MNWVGLAAAVAAFLGIWIGHVAVRRVEAVAPRLWGPVVTGLALGFGLEYWSLLTKSRLWSGALGVLGIILLWDAFELFRQERRVKDGHAPANPDNPRHARLLKEYPNATTVDLLRNEPTGIPSS